MDEDMAKTLNIPLVPLTGSLIVKALDGTWLRSGRITERTIPLQMYARILDSETLSPS